MALNYPDILQHNNPNLAIADSNFVRGGTRTAVADLIALYALSSKVDQLKQDATRVYVTAEAKYYVLIDIGNVGNSSGWAIENDGAVDSVNGQVGIVVLDADDIDDTLTTNKFVTSADLTILSNTSGVNTGDQDLSSLATITYVDNQDFLKVDKVVGKGLSTNDFTDILKTKLDGIQDGAEVNVNADWNAISGDAQILNKPIIPTQGITSVALTMPSAFTVTNSPLISDGTLIVSGAGTTEQYVRGDGTLATLPVTPTFTGPLTVSLSGGKTFGKYKNLDVIPATGKTAAEVIQLAIVEALDPIVTLSSPTTIAFNQVIISNVLNFSYIIKSLDGVVATVSLEWKRAGSPANGGTDDLWVVLSTNTAIITFTHPAPNNSAFNTNVYNYRYIVTDDKTGTATALFNITPAAYVAPSVSLLATAVTSTSPETNSTREKGNINTNLSGSVTRNSVNVAMTSYTLQYSLNNSTWVDINSAVPLSGASQVIPVTNHNDPTLFNATNIYYRVKVIDAYQTYISFFSTGGNTTISFFYLIFYGPASTTPTTSAQVRALPFRNFTPTTSLPNPFTFGTGTVTSIFTVALPTPVSTRDTIKFWTDDNALDADVVNTNNPFSVADAFGTLVTYNVYTAVNGTPYTPTQHIFRVTTE